mmetsp:Transcript_13957/g.49110  ORF Transcript_13957/g.49110 Transcript_13957/m.49110 type:complete len:213 (+) Transcript_13957:1513-2151(+)
MRILMAKRVGRGGMTNREGMAMCGISKPLQGLGGGTTVGLPFPFALPPTCSKRVKPMKSLPAYDIAAQAGNHNSPANGIICAKMVITAKCRPDSGPSTHTPCSDISFVGPGGTILESTCTCIPVSCRICLTDAPSTPIIIFAVCAGTMTYTLHVPDAASMASQPQLRTPSPCNTLSKAMIVASSTAPQDWPCIATSCNWLPGYRHPSPLKRN